MEDGEDLNEDVGVELEEVVPDVLKDGEDDVQAGRQAGLAEDWWGLDCLYLSQVFNPIRMLLKQFFNSGLR